MADETKIGKKSFRKDLHYFRAISIAIIVLGHSVEIWPKTEVYGYVSVFLKGNTGLFVFISGFFFLYLLKDDFNYLGYLKKKFQNVIIPYIVLSTLTFFYLFLFHKQEFFGNKIFQYISMLLYGKAYASFWYIPFITLVFFAAPVFIWLYKRNALLKVLVLLVSIILAIIIRRPKQTENPIVIIHSFFYFFPYYFMGILFCQYRDKIGKKIYNIPFFIAASILSIVTIVINVNYWQNYDETINIIFQNDGLLTLISKINLIISILILTKWINSKDHYLLKLLGDTSFSVYFLHLAFMQRLTKFIIPFTGDLVIDSVSAILFSISSIVLSIITARFFKNILNEKSRYLIGY